MIVFLAAASIALAQGPASMGADTAAQLRAAVHAHPDSFDLLLALGRYLARNADEVGSNWEQRIEAEGIYERAFRMRPHDPRMLLEYGLLYRKQRKNVDGMRLLKRAEDAAAQDDSVMTVAERADLHEQMALLYQVWWEDWAGLSKRQEELKYDDRDAMMHHFAAAFALDSNRTSAAVSWLRWKADWQKWDDYIPTAEALARHRPHDAEALLFLALGYHEAGRHADADTVFRRVIVEADPELRASLLTVAPLLRDDDIQHFTALSAEQQRTEDWEFWQQRDPLFLTPENERIAEHFARVAYADLAFTDPNDGIHGRNTAQGHIWVWYGRPAHVSMSRVEGGRYIHWHYGDYTKPVCNPYNWKLPPDTQFTFSRLVTYRRAGYVPPMPSPCSLPLANLRRDQPESYHPTHPRMVLGTTTQIARFRVDSGKTELVTFAHIPLDLLGPGDSVKTGFYAFVMHPWQSAAGGATTASRRAAERPASYSATLSPGRYLVSVEAMVGDRASTKRDTVEIAPPSSGLALSDILFADRVVTRVSPARTRAELAIDGATSLMPKRGAPVGVVWEAYNLQADSAGVARYHVRLEVRDARGGLVRALRAVTLQGNNNGTILEWDADRPLGTNGVALEYATLTLEGAGPGTYRLLVTVTDRVSGATVTNERRFTVIP